MKAVITLITLISLLGLSGCSDSTDKNGPQPVAKQSAPSPVKTDLNELLQLRS
ncbi:MAG: hypothetical protein HN472_12770 [Nitrospina sp.]|nr:hypothetical protein [Nitrospina sp.]MBT5347522.1 hypothetical protein [Nitrospina sp.]MBT6248723.1 hypothetical protein [Nitrospina sp.]